MKKLSFYLSLLKFSLYHPRSGLDLINEANQVSDDANEEFKKFEFQPINFSQALNLISRKNGDVEDDLTKIDDLEKHLKYFFENISGEYPSVEKPYPVDYSIVGESGPFLYKLCKLVKPKLIVETGVAYGVSSSYILKALDENNKGKLISIDSIFRPWQSKEMIGAAIPKNLRNRWELKIGTSEKILKKTLTTLPSIDIFLHDSLHTYKNMHYEFKTSWPFIKDNGFLLSDDISGNNAFSDFYKSIKKEPIIMLQNLNSQSYLGIIRK